LSPQRQQLHGYGSSVGVISLAKAVIRGTPSPVVGESIREVSSFT
jgi:hypothetical protein